MKQYYSDGAPRSLSDLAYYGQVKEKPKKRFQPAAKETARAGRSNRLKKRMKLAQQRWTWKQS